MITQAFSSNLKKLQSFLQISLEVLTTTALTTFFFPILPVGEAFLTEQTITSQTEAYLLLDPHRTFIHRTSLAQLLSAT
jgi:hypothetical protein